MIRLLLLFLGYVAAFGAPSLSYAQEWPLTGKHGRFKPAVVPPDSAMSDADRGRLTARRFGDCVYRRRPSRVIGYFALKADSGHGELTLRQLATENCLVGGTLEMPHALYRGALFRAAYFHEYTLFPKNLSATPIDYLTFVDNSNSEFSVYYVATMQFAQCLVRNEPQKAVAFIRAYPGSLPEKAAYDALAPHFSGCLSSGSQIALNRSMIEAMLSEAVYREAKSATAISPIPEAKK